MATILQDRLWARMTALGKSQAEISAATGMGSTVVRDIISGRSANPGVFTVQAIAKVLGCTIADLLGDQQPAPHPIDFVYLDFEDRSGEAA